MKQEFKVEIAVGSADFPVRITIIVNKSYIYLNMAYREAEELASFLSRDFSPSSISFRSNDCPTIEIGPTEQSMTYKIQWMSSDYINIRDVIAGTRSIQHGRNFLIEAPLADNLSNLIVAKIEGSRSRA